MGCDIHSFAEVKKGGKWIEVEDNIFGESDGYKKLSEPFGWRNYSIFSFLADVRNNSGVIPISEPKGLPDDSEYLNSVSKYAYETNPMNNEPIPIEERETVKMDYEHDANYHSASYLTLRELLDFDYEKEFEDLRTSRILKGNNMVMMGAIFDEKANVGEGTVKTYREFLGTGYFRDLDVLKSLGEPENVRIIFWFDN